MTLQQEQILRLLEQQHRDFCRAIDAMHEIILILGPANDEATIRQAHQVLLMFEKSLESC